MDRSESYMNVTLGKTDSLSPSRAEPGVLYAEVNFKTPSAPRLRTDGDGLNSTYADMKFRKEESRIDEDESPPISPGPDGLPTTAQTGAQKQELKQKIRNRTCLLCLVTFTLAAIVSGLSIYVSQIRHSKVTSDCKDHELNSTLQSKLSALNSNLSVLKGINSDLRHQLTEVERKYRSVSETKAHICELLINRRESTCPENWIKNEDRCYFISEIAIFYDGAREKCSELDSRLLEINSNEEKQFVFNTVNRFLAYWIGKCADGNMASELLYYLRNGSSTCSKCGWDHSCISRYRFICEKSAHLNPGIPEEIRGLCQQTVGSSFPQKGVMN